MTMPLPDLTGRVAIVTGSSRGIGAAVAVALARAGCDVTVAAKSTEERPHLPGTIYTAAAAVEAEGRRALPVACDVRDDAQIEAMVAETVETFGRLDILINNAGALWWKDVTDTPMKRFDLVMDVNARASFATTRAALPHMIEQGWGHIVMMSPPLHLEMVGGKVAYCISKFGMTLIALGLAKEVRHHNVACNALWPATIIESRATINYQLGTPEIWRKADIIADATLAILSHAPGELTGEALIDEDILRRVGVTDLDGYSCVEGGTPVRLIEAQTDDVGGSTTGKG